MNPTLRAGSGVGRYQCYLICFAELVKGKKHYIGMTERGVHARFDEHVSDIRSAGLTREANARGVEYYLVRSWLDVPVEFERKLKKRHGAATMCPRCCPLSWQKNAVHTLTSGLLVPASYARAQLAGLSRPVAE